MATKVLLDDFRNDLIRQEETIIFALIERAQFVHNRAIYRKREEASDALLSFKGKYHSFQGSFLDFMLTETERLHALNRRYTSPDEHAFFPAFLPDPILPPLDYPPVLIPNKININDQVMNVYLEKLLPNITVDDDDHTTYGSTANADIAALQALSKRIHFGKFIAEAKFQAETERYTELIRNNDADGIMDALTNLAVEDKVAMRVRLKASTYGQDVEGSASSNTGHCKIDPQVISDLYRDFVMPLTKQVQVAYLLQRLHHPSVSFVGPVGSFAHAAAIAHFGAETQRNMEPVASLSDVFASVVARQTAYGIVAFEDAQTGIAKEAQHLLISSGLQICAETVLERHLLFAGSPSSTGGEIETIYVPVSADTAFGLIIDRVWSSAKVVQVASIDEAARCASHQPKSIALTTSDVAHAVGLVVVEPSVPLSTISRPPPALSVRFIVVGRSSSAATGKDKTCLCLNVKHEVGSLLSALQVFKDHGVNLTALESLQRNAVGGEFGFYVELDGHRNDTNVQAALEALRPTTQEVRFLGSFPVHGPPHVA
ncbi:unnamed protein product [Aphanomyces euteiches]|uniref:chorismate mutase n=1 Tax=Aphanomyces euteiches TaxID=100861 RepID=A0A6G0XKS1_9STRA|nr:hypothetical protein Ae201684_003820 [Aphanomyces euteiches]KAH9084713.1 hypothetical protein Ae201684P_001953 [Aphanomyces euteiches]KAH9145803.1 hypothetical protein AeRB84_010311 [Aphanomyces euteiches]